MDTYIVTSITHCMVETVVEATDEADALAKFKRGEGDDRYPEILEEIVQSVELEQYIW